MKFLPIRLAVEIFPVLIALLFCGSRSGIGAKEVGIDELGSYCSTIGQGSGFSVATNNILGNYLLLDRLDDGKAELLIKDMEQIFRRDRRMDMQFAIAETALFLADRFITEPERRAGLLLTSLIHCSNRLTGIEYSRNPVFSPESSRLLAVYNQALTGLFCYLNDKKIALNGSFSLNAAGGQDIFFAVPFIRLPVKGDHIKDFIPCALFRTKGLTHYARRSGIGVPLICNIKPENANGDPALDGLFNIPATLLFNMDSQADITAEERLKVRLEIVDSRRYDYLAGKVMHLPLEQDFSTPLAVGSMRSPEQNFIYRTLVPESNKREGLYLLQVRDHRIPVLFVHGLMSDIRTWLQMVNTLQSDPDIRKNCRFMGFSYSSGNPILFSAHLLREALNKEREKLISSGIPADNFDRMIVIGHSMGGLLTRLLVSSSTGANVRASVGDKVYDAISARLDDSRSKLIGKRIYFQPFSSVKRAVFIASPHKGAEMARSWYGRLGAKLIQLPGKLLEQNKKLITVLLGAGEKEYAKELEEFNGIFNLAPGGIALKLINSLALPQIPCHSIIGNRKNDVPGGSDGVVAYSSSHLDGVASELVVRHGHSVQQNALAIQEVRRILLLHLKELGVGNVPGNENIFTRTGFSGNEEGK